MKTAAPLVPMAKLRADDELARKTFGPQGTRIVHLLAMVTRETPQSQFDMVYSRWNTTARSRTGEHAAATQEIWAGAENGGIRRSRLLTIDRYVSVARGGQGPWRDTIAQTLLGDACLAEAAREWIGPAKADALVADWKLAFKGF